MDSSLIESKGIALILTYILKNPECKKSEVTYRNNVADKAYLNTLTKLIENGLVIEDNGPRQRNIKLLTLSDSGKIAAELFARLLEV